MMRCLQAFPKNRNSHWRRRRDVLRQCSVCRETATGKSVHIWQNRSKKMSWHLFFWDMKSRDLTSRDLTTRHQIKHIATSWTSVGPRKNRTCWTISELNPVCHDSTAAFIVACSFCVQSAILSALIRSPYSRGSTTAATATAARTKTRTGQLQESRNRQRPRRQHTRTTVAKCASWRHVLASHCRCRAGIEHVDSIQDDAMMTKKTFRNWSISQ